MRQQRISATRESRVALELVLAASARKSDLSIVPTGKALGFQANRLRQSNVGCRRGCVEIVDARLSDPLLQSIVVVRECALRQLQGHRLSFAWFERDFRKSFQLLRR